MEYAVEIWGWFERKDLEKIQYDYLRWVLKLDFNTPRYIILRETNSQKLKVEWGKRAVRFEEKIEKLGEERLVKICWLEKMEDGERDRYYIEREKYYNSLGLSTLEIGNMKREDKPVSKETVRRDMDIEKQIIEGKIREAKYNKKYKDIMSEGLPKYLRKWGIGKELELMARLRCGNFEEANKYWLKDEERYCRLCKSALGTWEHLVKDCDIIKIKMGDITKERGMNYESMANEMGNREAIEIMKCIKGIREESCKENVIGEK